MRRGSCDFPRRGKPIVVIAPESTLSRRRRGEELEKEENARKMPAEAEKESDLQSRWHFAKRCFEKEENARKMPADAVGEKQKMLVKCLQRRRKSQVFNHADVLQNVSFVVFMFNVYFEK